MVNIHKMLISIFQFLRTVDDEELEQFMYKCSYCNMVQLEVFLAPTGALGITMSVCLELSLFISLSVLIREFAHQHVCSSECVLIRECAHQRVCSSESMFIKEHVHQRASLSESILTREHAHHRACLEHAHLRACSSEGVLIGSEIMRNKSCSRSLSILCLVKENNT